MFHSHSSPHTPCFDISETDNAYFLDGDFPGVVDKADISLKWTGKRTLVIEADVPKLDYEAMWDVSFGKPLEKAEKHEDANHKGMDSNGNTKAPGTPYPGLHPSLGNLVPSLRGSQTVTADSKIRHWVKERHTGHLYRTFAFPEDVDTHSIKAKLHQGQLNMMVSKSEPVPAEKQRVDIADWRI